MRLPRSFVAAISTFVAPAAWGTLRSPMRLNRFGLLLSAVLALMVAMPVHATVTITLATGGGAISADASASVPLTGPTISEGATGDICGVATLVLSAPAGFNFDTSSAVTVQVVRTSGSGSNNRNINRVASGTSIATAVTATTITFNLTSCTTNNVRNQLTWQNIHVLPASKCPLPSPGDITLYGISMGALAEVIGASSMYTVLPGQTFTACSGVSGTPANQTAGVAFNLTSLVVADQWGNVNTAYAGSKTISYSGPTGANSYTTSVAFSNGVSTTTLATTINTAQTTTLTATDGSVAGAASSPFTVSAPICATTPPWYNPAWQYRKAITIDHTKVGGTVSNFPVLVSVTDANLQANAQASGNDILFTDSGGTTKLAHEVELYTSASGQLIAWVSVPSLSAGADTVIYMYYGNPAAAAQQNPNAVWDANFSGVWHLKETGNGTAGEYKDSTSNANNARGGNGSSAATPSRVAGRIGYGQSFNGSQLINGATSSMPAINGNQTMSFWYQVASNPTTTRSNFFTLRTTGGGSGNQGVFVGTVSGSCAAYASPIGATQWGGTCTI
ncbi:MAG: DUF2341 domain-containing protein, partial [Burkholderiales bacterium]